MRMNERMNDDYEKEKQDASQESVYAEIIIMPSLLNIIIGFVLTFRLLLRITSVWWFGKTRDDWNLGRPPPVKVVDTYTSN